MRWTPWSFLGGGGGDEPPRWGHSPRMRRGGSGYEGSLPNSFGWEFILFIKTHLCGGALTSHFMEEHSSLTLFPVSWWRHQMETCSASLAFLRGIHRSSVNSPHTDQWRRALMFSLNKRLSKQSRRRWFETPSRSLWRHCNVPNSDPLIRAAVRSSAFNASLLSNFELVKRVTFGGFRALWKEWPQIWHTALPWLPFLEINYIFCTQRQFKIVV